MKLPFETWLDQLAPPDPAAVAFREAVTTYKTGAYRAALLFSYVGMSLCLRLRIRDAARPDAMKQGEWQKIREALRNENRWDRAVFDCTQMKAPKLIFHVEDQLRTDMRYWRDRRNDCAHFKNNEIGAPHVEAFWLFLRSNLGRWVPNGSVDDVLDRINRHFDPNLTPPGDDVAPIVRMLPQAVPEAGLPAFFEKLKGCLTSTTGKISHVNRGALDAVFHAILAADQPTVAPAAVSWLVADPETLVRVLRREPKHVHILSKEPKLVRSMWRKRLAQGRHPVLPVFAALLRGGLIPDTEIEDAVSHIVANLRGEIPTASDEPALSKARFWEAFDKKAFDNRGINDFGWGNPNALLIADRLRQQSLSEATVSIICSVFAAQPYPDETCAALATMLSANPEKMAELTSLAQAADLTVPTAFSRDPGP